MQQYVLDGAPAPDEQRVPNRMNLGFGKAQLLRAGEAGNAGGSSPSTAGSSLVRRSWPWKKGDVPVSHHPPTGSWEALLQHPLLDKAQPRLKATRAVPQRVKGHCSDPDTHSPLPTGLWGCCQESVMNKLDGIMMFIQCRSKVIGDGDSVGNMWTHICISIHDCAEDVAH